MVTVGVDLHKRVAQIAVLTPEGEVSQHRLETIPREITQFFAKLPAQTPVAVEASATWWWFIDLLEALGHRPVLSHPKQTKAIAAARLKNDRVDAARLAMLLRADLLPAVWIPPTSLREARELVRHRIRLTQLRTCLRNMLQSMLARRNLRPVEATKWMSVHGLQELAALSLPPAPSIIREDCFKLLHVFDAQIRELDMQLTSPSGVSAKHRSASSRNTPTLASARSTRYSEGGCVPVAAARSSLRRAPSFKRSATPSLEATWRACDTLNPLTKSRSAADGLWSPVSIGSLQTQAGN